MTAHNRYFATLAELLTTFTSGFNGWTRPHLVLRRLGGTSYDAICNFSFSILCCQIFRWRVLRFGVSGLAVVLPNMIATHASIYCFQSMISVG